MTANRAIFRVEYDGHPTPQRLYWRGIRLPRWLWTLLFGDPPAIKLRAKS